MPCQHLKDLFQLCETRGLRLASSDVIRVTCQECGQVEVCPSVLLDEYEAKTGDASKTDDESVSPGNRAGEPESTA